LAESGLASRRKAEKLVADGRVTVNGTVVQELGFQVEPGSDFVLLDGKPVRQEDRQYYLLYKPSGYISAVTDPRGRPTVVDLLKGVEVRIYPVGRLDYDTAGLIVLTNDGDFALALSHPRHGVEKEYQARVLGRVTPAELLRLEQGVDIGDFVTSPAKAEVVGTNAGTTTLRVTIHEGKYRQVRRMCEAIGHRVVLLTRIRYGDLTLEGLEPGQFRRLNAEEVSALFALAVTSGTRNC
jgi:23S rRNA pseudouridine2605 synthase